MLTKKGGVLDKAGIKYSPNLDHLVAESAEAVGAVGSIIPIPDISKWKKSPEKEEVLSVKAPLKIEDSESGAIIYLSQPVVRRQFWYKERMPGFPYNLHHGASYWQHFLSVGIIVEMKKQYGSDDVQCCLRDATGEKRQEIQHWVYDALCYINDDCLEWNNFFVIDGDIIFEIRAYTGKNAGNTIIDFIFDNQEEAEKFTLPEWANSCVSEITYNRYFKDAELAASGFPRS